ncbi:uncharacterized protein [Dermacentor andersoni]|uniref:uncharacterized protein isoform X1 n=1 Tax=Dermacentor andersoni TaxID=34620 RepID=UPI002415C55A|nr:uncharacterized protein LOC126516248 isoform X2 [Dermacentor andersoni]
MLSKPQQHLNQSSPADTPHTLFSQEKRMATTSFGYEFIIDDKKVLSATTKKVSELNEKLKKAGVIVKKKAEDKFVVKVMDLTKATAASHKTALGHKEHSVQTNADRTTPGKRTVRIDNYDGARAIVDTYKTVGHTQRTKMTNGENMRARFHLKEIHQLCWLGHHHATGTLVTVVATGLTEELSRRLASFVIRHLPGKYARQVPPAKTYERCWLGHEHATGTRVTVVATGLTEDFSRRVASFVVGH